MNAPFAPHASLAAQQRIAEPHRSAADASATRWAAIHDAAEAVCAIAGRPLATPGAPAWGMPSLLAAAEEDRREQAEKAIADIAAMMEAGLAALLTVNARGADPRPAAEALWQEYSRARDGVIVLLSAANDAGSTSGKIAQLLPR